MYKINTKSADDLDVRVYAPLDYLMMAKKICKPAAMRKERLTKLASDPFVIDYNQRGLRRVTCRPLAGGSIKLTGQTVDVAEIIRQNLPDSKFESKYSHPRYKANGCRIVTNKKDTWYLNPTTGSEASTVPTITTQLIEHRPVTYELMPVCGHFLWQYGIWFIVNLRDTQTIVETWADNPSNQLPKHKSTFLAVRHDNMEVRRMSFKYLPLRRYVKQTAEDGLPEPGEAVGAMRAGYPGITGLRFYTASYKQQFGIGSDSIDVIWPMWLARELLMQDPTCIRELGWILFEHCISKPDWLEKTGLWCLLAARRATYIKRRGEAAWEDRHKHFHPIFSKEADRVRIQSTQETFSGRISAAGGESDESDYGSCDEHGGCESLQGYDHPDPLFVNA